MGYIVTPARRILRFSMITAAASLLAGCGGGGGDGGGGGTSAAASAYSGNRDGAEIQRAAAAELAGGYQSSMLIVRFLQGLYVPPPGGNGPVTGQGNCPAGGSFTATGENSTESSVIDFVFANCAADGLSLDGRLKQRRDNTVTPLRVSFEFSGLQLDFASSQPGVNIAEPLRLRLNGELDYTESSGSTFGTTMSREWRSDLVMTDTNSGEQIWVNDFTIQVDENENRTYDLEARYIEERVTGRIYESELGFVSVAEPVPFRYRNMESVWPYWGGKRTFAGANGTSLSLDPLEPENAIVSVDADGNGADDDSRLFTWTDIEAAVLSSAAAASVSPGYLVVDAGPTVQARTGNRAQLNGSRSHAGDEWLRYEWSLAVKPAGSAAVLDDPLSPQPSFLADVSGHYLATLKVSSGTEVRHDSVVVSVTDTYTPTVQPVISAPRPTDADQGGRIYIDPPRVEYPWLPRTRSSGWVDSWYMDPTFTSRSQPGPAARQYADGGRQYINAYSRGAYRLDYVVDDWPGNLTAERYAVSGSTALFYRATDLHGDAITTQSFATTDSNDDGLDDLVLLTRPDHSLGPAVELTLLEQVSPGAFVSSAEALREGHPGQLVSGDLDSDGLDEIVFANCGEFSVFDPQPAGTHSRRVVSMSGPRSLCAEPGTPSYGVHMDIGDFDADGRNDLMVASTDPATGANVWLQNANGELQPAPAGRYAAPAGYYTTRGDIDLDGHLDEARLTNGGQLEIRFRNAEGSFGEPVVVDSPYSTRYLQTPEITDWDGDGLPDLVHLAKDHTTETNYLVVQLQRSRTDYLGPLTTALAVEREVEHLKVVDIDDDGLNEVITWPYMMVFDQLSPGLLNAPVELDTADKYSEIHRGGRPNRFLTADINGDGLTDLLYDGFDYPYGDRAMLGVFLQRPPDTLAGAAP